MPDERREFWALNAYRGEERERESGRRGCTFPTLLSLNIGLQLPVITEDKLSLSWVSFLSNKSSSDLLHHGVPYSRDHSNCS